MYYFSIVMRKDKHQIINELMRKLSIVWGFFVVVCEIYLETKLFFTLVLVYRSIMPQTQYFASLIEVYLLYAVT